MRVGSICYATRQGLGILAKQFYQNGVIDDVLIYKHPRNETFREWFPRADVLTHPFDMDLVKRFIQTVDVMLFFETPFDFRILDLCRSCGVKTAIIPNYEWSLKRPPSHPDLYICGSLLDCTYFPGSPFLPIPVPNEIKWKQRTNARKFLHNGGHLGCRGHKGTLEIVKAMDFVKSPIEMVITSQNESGLHEIMQKCDVIGKQDSRIKFKHQDNSVAYDTLFDEGDVFIMAEKFNGMSLPLQEARAAGMLVMTSKRFPMTEWLPKEYLIPVHRYDLVSVGGGHRQFDEATVRPEDIAAKIDSIYNINIEAYSRGGKMWAEQNSWAVLKDKYLQLLGSI